MVDSRWTLIAVAGAGVQAEEEGGGRARQRVLLRDKGAGTRGPDYNQAIGAAVGGFEGGPASPYLMLRSMGTSLRLQSVLRIAQVIKEFVFIFILVVLSIHGRHTL